MLRRWFSRQSSKSKPQRLETTEAEAAEGKHLMNCPSPLPPWQVPWLALLFHLLLPSNLALRAQVAMSAILAVLAAALFPKPQRLALRFQLVIGMVDVG